MNQTKLPFDKLNNMLIFLKKEGLSQENAEDIVQDSCIVFLEKEKTIEILDPFSYFFNIVKMKLLNYFSVKKRRKTSIISVASLNNIPRVFTPVSYNEGEFSYDHKQYLKRTQVRKLKKNNPAAPQAQLLYAIYHVKKNSANSKFKSKFRTKAKVIIIERYDQIKKK